MRPILSPAGVVLALGAALQPLTAQDSTAYTSKPEVRFGLTSDGVTRAMSLAGAPPFKQTTRLNGVEFMARSPKSGGIQARYTKGEFDGPLSDASAGPLEYIDGRLLVGPRKFAVHVGYLGRTQNYNEKKRRFDLARGGAQMTYQFEGAGVGLNLAGSYLRTITKAKNDSLEADGFEGETSLLYAVPRFPVFVQLGYRREIFNISKENTNLRREEVSGVLMSIGVHYGLSTR
ncbi:MAG TPA: hypothetical protein VM076_04825 [Gemmatimonadaceae bacterium]|nr:hypothetical protein [Gemmatimonadaceae bacterium]